VSGVGWWTGVATAASVDWCEPNYTFAPWVAEVVNTATSLPMGALGAYGAWRAWRTGEEARWALGFAGLGVVGFGSAAFHGTLLRGPQALDELPMVWLGLVGVWLVFSRAAPSGTRRGAAAAAALAVYAAIFTALYLWMEDYFQFFIATYGLLVAAMTVTGVHHTWIKPGHAASGPLLMGSILCYLGSLAFFWIPEHVLLPCEHPLQALHLHGLWHLGAGYGTWLWLLWARADRAGATGRDVSWDGWLVPWLRVRPAG
jgi:dihydroceramidase